MFKAETIQTIKTGATGAVRFDYLVGDFLRPRAPENTTLRDFPGLLQDEEPDGAE